MFQKLNSSGKKYIIISIILIFFQSALLFISAGNIYILRYWLFVIIQLGYIVFSLVILYFKTPELLNERGKKKEEALGWDVKLVKIINIQMVFILPVLIGLDYRLFWSYFNYYFLIPGFLLYAFSNLLVLQAMMKNKFFETNIRIQSDREHKIIKEWPYSFVRHPGYLGTILWLISVPFILGSLVGLLFSNLIIAAFILRTYHEDKFLAKELHGYKEYQKEIKYKLFPGIW